MNTELQEFYSYAARGLKYAAVSILLVPIYFMLMNPHFGNEGYWSDLWISTRIGIQMSLFYTFCTTIIYVVLYRKNKELYNSLKKSLKFQILKGMSIMLLGLLLMSVLEPYISGRNFGLQSITIGALVGGITLMVLVLYVNYQQTYENNLKLQVQSAESNLSVLKNQLQPHFLFNSLNTLSELIDSKNENASDVAQKLSDLYRDILTNSKQQFTLLTTEISIVENYLKLEKLRFGPRLKYEIAHLGFADKIYLPSLILQTLVENSIKHRISKSIEGGLIKINIIAENNGFKIEVGDEGPIDLAVKPEGTGTGLENTKSRLKLLYAEKSYFNFFADKNHTVVHFWVSGKNVRN